jgi:hypothetical protein
MSLFNTLTNDQLVGVSATQTTLPQQQEDWQHAASLLNAQPSSNHNGDHPKACLTCGIPKYLHEFELLSGGSQTERLDVCRSCQPASVGMSTAPETDLIRCKSCTFSKLITEFEFRKPLKAHPHAPLTRQRTCMKCLEKRADMRPSPKRTFVAPVPGPKRYCAWSDKTRRDGCPAEDFPMDETVNTCDTHTAIRRQKSALRKEQVREEEFSDSLQGLLDLSATVPSPLLATLPELLEGENTNADDEVVVLGAADVVEDSAVEGSEAEFDPDDYGDLRFGAFGDDDQEVTASL